MTADDDWGRPGDNYVGERVFKGTIRMFGQLARGVVVLAGRADLSNDELARRNHYGVPHKYGFTNYGIAYPREDREDFQTEITMVCRLPGCTSSTCFDPMVPHCWRVLRLFRWPGPQKIR